MNPGKREMTAEADTRNGCESPLVMAWYAESHSSRMEQFIP